MEHITPMVAAALARQGKEEKDLDNWKVVGSYLYLYFSKLVVRVEIASLPTIAVDASRPYHAQNVGEAPDAA